MDRLQLDAGHPAARVEPDQVGVTGQSRSHVGEALGAGARFLFARHQDLDAGSGRPGALHERDILGDVRREEALGIEHLGINVEGQHAVGEAAALGIGRPRARERPAQDLAHEGETRALVVAEGADGAGALAVVARAGWRPWVL